jgi:DNA replication protein DnaC
MIKRKAVTQFQKHLYWNHYHKMIDLSNEGNQELFDRLENLTTNQKHYVLANIPEKYYKFQFEQIKQKLLNWNQQYVEKIEKYMHSLDTVAQKGIGLYISGPHGVAKTTISVIILKLAVRKYFRCFFWKSSEIIEFIKSGWKNEFRKVFFDYIINTVDFLVIDDVSRLFNSEKNGSSLDDAVEKMYIDKIFTKRDDMNLATIITTNNTLSENRSRFGEALYSNFKEKLIEINIQGEDFRQEIGNKLEEELDGK